MSDDEELDGLEKEYRNRKHSALTRQGKYERSNKAWHGTPRSINCTERVGDCFELAAICTIKLGTVQAVTFLQSKKSTMEIDNYEDTAVLGANCLPIHDFGRAVDVSGWDSSAGSV